MGLVSIPAVSAEEKVRVVLFALAAIVLLILLVTVRFVRWTKPIHPSLERLDAMKVRRRKGESAK